MTRSPQTPGFTLIETIIAIGILVVLLTIVASAYGRFVGLQRQGIGQQETQEDVRLFLQLFNREARTAFGTTYETINKGVGVVFRNQENNCVRYLFDPMTHTIGRAEATPVDTHHHCADPDLYTGASRQLTDAENTVIANLLFEVVPAEPKFDPASEVAAPTLLTKQGFVTVYLDVHSVADATQKMQLQSTVTSRQFTPYAQ